MADRPALPKGVDPAQLGFTRQPKMVRWLSPTQLLRTGVQVVLSETFGAYSDKRDILANRVEDPPTPYPGTEIWVDYVADLGDAFEPTYSIASLLARPELTLAKPDGAGVTTPRGRVLVMGGDEVYPTASIRAYENQTVGPYRAALPYVEPEDQAPHLYTIPGNHDWYDGLTAFTRVFCRRQWVGGWRTQQTRSYFAIQLPQRWWIWGIDFQFDSYIDEAQFQYFDKTIGPAMAEGDSVILCTPTPAWVYANERKDPSVDAYSTIDYVDRELIRGRGEVRLMITGDAHHYARYAQSEGRSAPSPSSEGRSAPSPSSEGRSAQKITAGGGGAFLSATHSLPETLTLPPDAAKDPGKTSPATSWALQKAYPSKAESRRLSLLAYRIPLENGGLWVLIGLTHLAFAWMANAGAGNGHFVDFMARLTFGGLVRALVNSALALGLTLVLVLGLAAFTKCGDPVKKWGLGVTHAAVQILAILVTIWGAARICSHLELPSAAFVAVFVLVVGGVGGLIGSEILATYLLVANWLFDLNDNELFAAHRNRNWKNFVRMHVGADGVLTVYPVGVERTPRKWALRTGGNDDAPWFEPEGGPVGFTLIEAPIRIEPSRRSG